MKTSYAIIIQAAVWITIWAVFSFTGNTADRLPGFYLLNTLWVLGFIVFFNVFHRVLLPIFFAGKKMLFTGMVLLTLTGYVAYSVVIDINFRIPEKLSAEARKEVRKKKQVPLEYLIIPSIFLGLMLFGAAASVGGLSAFEKKKKSEEEANRRRLEAEIALLKSQINPHFLVNTLNNLYVLSLTEPDKTPSGLLKLSEMVSYILYECAKPMVPLALDIEFIENYIALQHLRLPPNAHLQVDLPSVVPPEIEIEPMILIPFIENAFKHGLTTKAACELLVSIQLRGKQLTLEVKNPVLPLKPEQSGNPSGIGLANTQQRLEHSYPNKHSLSIHNDGQTHVVKLQINLAP
ncbi:MAG: histidine kinase [Haliscomenobacter sp.]|nr:histidine kinase [Haliscomenobacter sp.]MBK9491805.1 histidine kinase [Haliscomenobacter sp.]